jgi:ubiquinone/menaquinone biosynthesis C-methylase UbiE
VNQRKHWEEVYTNKPADKLGWYEPHLQISLRWIKALGLAKDARIIDVGGGASTLIDDLLNDSHTAVTVLDLSGKALSVARARLDTRAETVTWLTGDITSIDLPENYYDLWHDRAVFHFLTTPLQQEQYRGNLSKALKPGGYVIIGTFAPEAPPTCSGLPVQRYSAGQLQNTLGHEFELQQHQKELHVTPGGVEQMYLYCQFRRKI